MAHRRIYRSLLALLALIGVSLQIYQDGWGMLLYYTVLSNIAVFISLIYFILWERRHSSINQNPDMLRLKAGVTMSIAITFVVYHFLLAPLVEPQDYYNIRNFLVHYLVPLGMIADTLILDKQGSYQLLDPVKWTLFPLAYFAFAIFNGLILHWPIPGSEDSPFPYFFINVSKYGWSTVLQNALLILLAYIVAGYVLYLLKGFLGPKKLKSPAPINH